MDYLTHDQMLNILADQVDVIGSRKALASSLGISDGYLCDVFKGNREISARLARALGYERLKVFVKKSNPE